MTVEDAYQGILDRIDKEENRERKRELEVSGDGGELGICFHLKRIQAILKHKQSRTESEQLTVETSLHQINHLLNKQGWK